MKKIKKILAVLSSVMVISTCTVSAVSADEASGMPADTAADISDEQITDPEVCVALIEEFIENEDIPFNSVSYEYIDETAGTYKLILCMNGDTSENTFLNLINDFIEEKNIYATERFVISDAVPWEYWFRDVNGDDVINIRDCAYIASALVNGRELNSRADYNLDGKADIRDVALLARAIAGYRD